MPLLDRINNRASQMGFGSIMGLSFDVPSIPSVTADQITSVAGIRRDPSEMLGTEAQQKYYSANKTNLQAQVENIIPYYGSITRFLNSPEGYDWKKKYEENEMNLMTMRETSKALNMQEDLIQGRGIMNDIYFNEIGQPEEVLDVDNKPTGRKKTYLEKLQEIRTQPMPVDQKGNVKMVTPGMFWAYDPKTANLSINTRLSEATKSERIGSNYVTDVNGKQIKLSELSGVGTEVDWMNDTNIDIAKSVFAGLFDVDASQVELDKNKKWSVRGFDVDKSGMSADEKVLLKNQFYRAQEMAGKNEKGEPRLNDMNDWIAKNLMEQVAAVKSTDINRNILDLRPKGGSTGGEGDTNQFLNDEVLFNVDYITSKASEDNTYNPYSVYNYVPDEKGNMILKQGGYLEVPTAKGPVNYQLGAMAKLPGDERTGFDIYRPTYAYGEKQFKDLQNLAPEGVINLATGTVIPTMGTTAVINTLTHAGVGARRVKKDGHITEQLDQNNPSAVPEIVGTAYVGEDDIKGMLAPTTTVLTPKGTNKELLTDIAKDYDEFRKEAGKTLGREEALKERDRRLCYKYGSGEAKTYSKIGFNSFDEFVKWADEGGIKDGEVMEEKASKSETIYSFKETGKIKSKAELEAMGLVDVSDRLSDEQKLRITGTKNGTVYEVRFSAPIQTSEIVGGKYSPRNDEALAAPNYLVRKAITTK